MSNHFPRAWIFLFMTLIASTVSGQVNEPHSDVEVSDDLRTVIILAGYQCKEVTQFLQTGKSEYHVSCKIDNEYLVRVSEEKGVTVQIHSGPPKFTSQRDTEHDAFMKRQLSAVVNLAGHDCAGVLSYERHGPKDNIVTCQDQTVFRIHVTPEGRVAVEKQPVEK